MKFKKLKKIFRILFPLNLTERKLFIKQLNSNSIIKRVEKCNNIYSTFLDNGTNIFTRYQNHNDYEVFKQVFVFEEYKIVLSIFENNIELDSEEIDIIDAGANIGYTKVYFSKLFHFSNIFCIEPSSSNIEILKKY